MPSSVVANSCRLTVLTRSTRVDLVVPIDVPVADLLTTLVAGLGPAVADDGIRSGGWVLQRIGDKPLDPARTLSMQNVTDGAVLHLLPRSQQMPEVAYDDVLDAVGSGVRERTARWRLQHSRRAYLTLAAVGLIFAFVTTLSSGPGWTVPTIVLGVGALLLLVGAASFARTEGSEQASVLAGGFAVLYAAGAGGCVLGKGGLSHFGAEQLVPAAGAAVLAAALGLALLDGRGVTLFVGTIGAGLLIAIGGTAALVSNVSAHGCAALTAIVALTFSPFLPVLSFRLSRLSLPNIPANADDLRADTKTVDGNTVLGQAARADEYLTGMVGAVAAAVSFSCLSLCTGHDVSSRVLVAVVAVICLLRARLFTGLGQRVALIAGGSIDLLALSYVLTIGLNHRQRLLESAVPVLLVVLLLLAGAVALPGRRLAPTWGRAADLLESALVLAVIPLAVGVLGVYGAVRGWSNK